MKDVGSSLLLPVFTKLMDNPELRKALLKLLEDNLSDIISMLVKLNSEKARAEDPNAWRMATQYLQKEAVAPTAPPKAEAVPNLVSVKLFREQYPDGSASTNERLREIADGRSYLGRESSFWLDLTAYDAEGREYTPDRVRESGLAWRTSFELKLVDRKGALVGRSSITSNGDGIPVPVGDQDFGPIHGWLAPWRESMGFVQAWTLHDFEGEVIVTAKVGGVSAPTMALLTS